MAGSMRLALITTAVVALVTLDTAHALVCKLEADVGDCRAAIPRYFYNHLKGRCEMFSYGGCGGNKNNFLTKEECLTTCGTDVCSQEAEIGLCKAIIPRYFFNYRTGQCEMFPYGGCGGNDNNFLTQEECLATCGTVVCSQEAEIGPCKAIIPRYFFNYRTGQCEMFPYGGCGGNDNNFLTQEECLATCGTVVCSQEAEIGLCKAIIPRYFFNYRTGQCEMFPYGGCGGNDNNFLTQEECLATCGTVVCSQEAEMSTDMSMNEQLRTTFTNCDTQISCLYYSMLVLKMSN
jgi:hypothetical protein